MLLSSMLYGPTFAEMRDPALLPPALRESARGARARPLDPANLWNLSWRAEGAGPFTGLPDALTGVPAPLGVLSRPCFPPGSRPVAVAGRPAQASRACGPTPAWVGAGGAGEGVKSTLPAALTVAVEPVQCPRLFNVGFGSHRIEGIGDKHVTWIRSVWATVL